MTASAWLPERTIEKEQLLFRAQCKNPVPQ